MIVAKKIPRVQILKLMAARFSTVQYSRALSCNTPWTSFAMHSCEKATMAFQVKHISRTKNYFANPRIKIQENATRSL